MQIVVSYFSSARRTATAYHYWGLGIWPASQTLCCITWMDRIYVNILYSHANKAIWSAIRVRHFVSPRKGDLCDFMSDSLISKVTLRFTFGHAWGQWILTSFTHGCRLAQKHNGALPVVFSNVSTQADRTLSRRRWMIAAVDPWSPEESPLGPPPHGWQKSPLHHAAVLIFTCTNRFRHLYRSLFSNLSFCPF